MKTETVTYLKENANSLELNEELLVTKKGKRDCKKFCVNGCLHC